MYELLWQGALGTIVGALIGAWIASRLAYGFQKQLLQQQLDFEKQLFDQQQASEKELNEQRDRFFKEVFTDRIKADVSLHNELRNCATYIGDAIRGKQDP